MKDIKYLKVPNVCFSLTNKNDPREEEFKKQRIEKGFDDSETWSLDSTICKFIIPRLERYIEITNIMFDNTKDNNELLEDCKLFLNALKLHSQDVTNVDEDKQIQKGLELFPKIFKRLWW